MSSLVTAPGEPSSRPSPTTRLAALERHGLTRDFLFGSLGALALALVAFVATGGISLAPNTWVEIALILAGVAMAIAFVLFAAPGRAPGATALVLFATLAALTYASIAWSVQPATSWLEANRTLSYLAVFASGLMLARLAPGRWRALLGAVATAATVVCGYALLVKVFPGSLDPTDPLGRLQAPFAYWNAVGLMAALGLPACLWAGARPEPAPVLRTLAMPAIAIQLAALVLAYSRGAVIVALVGVVLWLALVPLRLRSLLVLAVGVAGGAVISAWGLATHGIAADAVGLTGRTNAGHAFGLVILVVLCLTTAAGFAATFTLDRFSLEPRVRRQVSLLLIGCAALIPVGGVVALAASQRGLTGEVSHVWNTITNPNGVVGDQPGRLVNLSNSRPHYWSEAISIGEHHLLAGVGALGFATAQPAYASAVWNPQHAHVVHAHGYLAETFADFGLIGLAVSIGLGLAWALATRRTLELSWSGRTSAAPRPPPGPKLSAERMGLVALLAIVVAFGIHSLIDWTWFIPGVAVPAMFCAGWLAGRGPLSDPGQRLQHRRALSRSPSAAGVAASAVVIALLAVWVIVQPLRSYNAYTAAINSALRGDASTAVTDARTAAAENPVSVDPLFLLSQIYSNMGNPTAARRELIDAASRQPRNPQAWQQLGCSDLARHNGAAWGELLHVVALVPTTKPAIWADAGAFCKSVAA